jgi:hypothetical protein
MSETKYGKYILLQSSGAEEKEDEAAYSKYQSGYCGSIKTWLRAHFI